MKPVISLTWGISLRSFSVDVHLTSQAATYTVRSMEPNTTEIKEAKATSSDIGKLGSSSKTGADHLQAIGDYLNRYESSKKTESPDERKAVAKARINKMAMGLLGGQCESIGLPESCAGRYIELKGLGKKLSQTYYITAVTHTIDGDSGFVTTFQVKGNTI